MERKPPARPPRKPLPTDPRKLAAAMFAQADRKLPKRPARRK